ncbi:MAG: diacylglycerol kinase family lipid kinase [Clostridia bacterium]|nr:diacylglycerol kinase family lipid kinase [Clostridia bacterium]
MANEKLLLIVNPCSGRAKMRPQLLKVIEIFSNAGYIVTVYPTKHQGDATELVSKLSKHAYDVIVACGGDGTLNEVITGLMESKTECRLGYIPSGTLNEWSTGLGISKIIPDAAKDIAEGTVAPLDIGKFGHKYFSYTASFGAFTSASYSTAQEFKNVLGQAAYVLEGIKSVGQIKPIHMKITADDREIEGDFLFGAISNSMSVGGIVKYDDSTVALNDGYFEMFLIRNFDNVLKLPPLAEGILRKDLDREGMEFLHARRITIKTDQPVSWTLDGEFAESSGKLKISNIHNAINFILPNKK